MSKLKDLTGRKFDRLTVIERAPDHIRPSGRRDVMWKCECSCGNVVVARGEHLRNHHKRSCGCYRKEATTQRMLQPIKKDTPFGKLVVIGLDRRDEDNGHYYYLCQCSCGNRVSVEANYLRSGHKTDCGCVVKQRKEELAESKERERICSLTKTCIVCGEEFIARQGNYKTCSKDCSEKNKTRFKSTEYKNLHTDFDNRKKHDREYYLANHEALKAKQNQYYKDVGKERVKTIMIPATCSWCQTDFEMRKDAFARGGGHYCSLECISTWQSFSRSGSKGPGWKGGITSLYYQIRNLQEYNEWRVSVYERDDFTCRFCGEARGALQAHHIKPRSRIMAEYNITTVEEALQCKALWEIDNGITLCERCHLGAKDKNPDSFHRKYSSVNFDELDFKRWFLAITDDFAEELGWVS